MFVRVLIGSMLSSVVLIAWGMILWGFSGLAFHVLKPLPEDRLVTQVLRESIREPGIYLYPTCPLARGEMIDQQAAMAEFTAKHEAGPLLLLSYRPQGAPVMQPAVMTSGFIHYLISSILMASLLTLIAPALASFGQRLLFVMLVGLFATVAIVLSDSVWMFQPWSYALFLAGYYLIGWLLAGSILAAIVKAKQAPALQV